MTNRKTTKRALVSSVIALFLCFTMLLGTTYAWFTDSVSTVNNIIKSGNLDIELYWSTDASNWSKVDESTNVFSDQLWEPGHTEVIYLKVVNEGSLALRYNLGVNVASETEGTNVAGEPFKLSNYIKFDVIDVREGVSFSDRAEAVEAVASTAKSLHYGYTKDSTMTAGDIDYVAMVVYMPEIVGNEANYKTGTVAPELNLGINLLATQYTYEEDSYGSDYDADALICDVLAYPDTLADVLANAQEGDVIGLANVSYYGGIITIPVNNLTLVSNGALVDSIDLNGKDGITIDGLTFDPNYTTIDVSKYDQTTASYVDTGYNANITNTTSTPFGADNIVIKNCTFIEGIEDWGFDASTYCAIAIEDAGRVSGSTTNLTVENCTFKSNSFEHLRLNYIGGDIVIKNNTFSGATAHHNINASGNKGNWTIIGNSFSNWADGEYAFGTSRNGSGVLTLIIEGNSFTKSMSAGAEIPVLSIKSSYTADNSIVVVENNVANAGAATIDAAIRSDYKYYMTSTATGNVYSFATPADAGFTAALAEENATVILGSGDYGKLPAIAEGVTVIGNGDTTFATHETAVTGTLNNATFKNINFSGSNAQRWCYANGEVVFENCTLAGNGVYAIHYDGLSGADVLYKDCTIIGWSAIGGGANSLTFDGCTIKGNGTYGVIRSYSDATIKNCTFDVDNVNTTDGYQDGIHAVDCEIIVENCVNVNGDIEDLFNVSGTGVITKK